MACDTPFGIMIFAVAVPLFITLLIVSVALFVQSLRQKERVLLGWAHLAIVLGLGILAVAVQTENTQHTSLTESLIRGLNEFVRPEANPVQLFLTLQLLFNLTQRFIVGRDNPVNILAKAGSVLLFALSFISMLF